jgi:dTMP kinase
VIVDRYVYSNIAFQCAKINAFQEQKDLANWIMDLEFREHNLPVPDMNIFLDVPFDFTKERLTGHRSGDDRQYLNGRQDIHENDLSFQERVRNVYHSICPGLGDLTIVDCANEQGQIKSPEAIFDSLIGVTGL